MIIAKVTACGVMIDFQALSFIFSGLSKQEIASVSEISATTKAHSETVENLTRDHSEKAACIEQCATNTLTQNYMVSPFTHKLG